jgi:hypothetical protein
MTLDRQLALKNLTLQAMEASALGQWDDVSVLYERRSREFQLHDVPLKLAKQLMEWDCTIQSRACAVYAAAEQNILQSQEYRRKLQHLKQSWIPISKPSFRFLGTM